MLLQLTAANIFNMYSNRILTKVNANIADEDKVYANTGT